MSPLLLSVKRLWCNRSGIALKRLIILAGVLTAATAVLCLSTLLNMHSLNQAHTQQNTENNLLKNNDNEFIITLATEKREAVRHHSRRSLWEYHSPYDGLFERTNSLLAANVLVLNNQKQFNIQNEVTGTGSNIGLGNNGQRIHLDRSSQWAAAGDGTWRSWPECLCGAPSGAECGPQVEPEEAKFMEHGAGGACSWRAREQSTDKVISVSAIGPPSRYGADLNILIDGSPQMYPGWSIWVYQRHPNPRELCPLLQSAPHVFFCDTRALPSLGDLKRTEAEVHKVSPLGDDRLQAVFVRGLNNSPLQREAAAVHEWLLSNTTWHIMRDHPLQDLPVEGGLWCARWHSDTRQEMAALRNILLTRAATWLTAGQISQFLASALVPRMQGSGSFMMHDSYRCNETLPAFRRAWPTRRVGDTFVGMRDEMEQLPDCPAECRPLGHKDWFTC